MFASRLRRPHLRPQCRHQPRHGFRQRRIGRHGNQLILPQIDVALGQRGKIERFGHGEDYTDSKRIGARA
jgi:hypothetical protein